MKINLIIFISEFNLGGAGNSLFKLCKNLPKNKFDITVICLNKCFYKSDLLKLKVKVIEISSNKTFLGMSKVKKTVKNLLKPNYKNIFLSNIYYSNILSILFLRSLNMKIIIVERTPFQELFIYYGLLDFFKKQIIKILISFTFNKADACIANSKHISNKYNEYYNLKFQTINPPSFQKILPFPKNKKKQICFGTISRLSKEKRIENLIKILPQLEYKPILKIVGDGPEKEKLKKLTKKLNLQGRVIFLGSYKPNLIKNALREFNYLINTSDFEGFPNSVVEAFSSGVPVIASQSFGGINDIIKDKNFGVIYKKKDDLKMILNKILKKKIKFNMDKKKLFKHLNNFSEKKNTENYKKLFLNI
jgi:glycosyltransferase involved in cell wall biosynthesis